MAAALLPPNLDYTDRDFASIRLRLFALISSVFPDWTDQNVANFGNILIELYAFTGDLLTFYQDNQAAESRIMTAQQRKNLIALCKLINFKPSAAQAAQATETFTLDVIPTGSVTIPKGSFCTTAEITDPVRFQLLADLVFAPGLNPPKLTATIENSETNTDTFQSSGLPNQQFKLSSNPFVDSSDSIVASDGTYARVDNFLSSGATDKHYTVQIDQSDNAFVTFGNGVNGSIPSGTITAVSKSGGGSGGNVEPGAINQIEGQFTDSFGNPVHVSVTNVAKAAGGLDRQSNAQIKLLAPPSIRALTRTVAREDFEIHAREVAGVARALMTTSNEDAAVPENTGILYIVPTGGGLPPQALKDTVKNLFITKPGSPAKYPSTLTFVVLVQDPLYLTVNVNATVWFAPGVLPAVGAAAIRAALKGFFSITLADGVTPNPAIDFGANYLDANGKPIDAIGGEPTLGLADIFDVVHDTPGVIRVGGKASDFTLNGAHADIPILPRQFPQLGTVTLVNGADGSLI